MGYDEMQQVGPYLRRFFNAHTNAWYYLHWCPACKEPHQYVVGGSPGHWTFNNDFQKPTFYPSMRLSTNIPRSPEEKVNRVSYTQCHYWVREGRIEFCTDSPHALAGQTVPLSAWPEQFFK